MTTAAYVPRELMEYWRKRDPIARFEKYLLEKKWLTPKQNQALIAAVEKEVEEDRSIAEASPLPNPEDAAKGAWCEGCHEIKPKYGTPKAAKGSGKLRQSEAAIHFK